MNNQIVEKKTDCERSSQSVFWVFSKQILDETILKGIQETNIEYRIIDYFDILSKRIPNDLDNRCVVIKCDLGSYSYLRHCKCIPGVYCNLPKFKCSSYYPYMSDLLLNSNYFLLPWKECKNRFSSIKGKFVRPDSGYKTFTGGIVDDSWLNTFIFDEELCLISDKQEIKEEYRFTIANSTIIGSSGYMRDNELLNFNDIPKEAFELASVACKRVIPDKVFCLDICKLQSREFKVVELNSFSCAGMYNTDFGNVIREVNKVALEEYQEYNNIN